MVLSWLWDITFLCCCFFLDSLKFFIPVIDFRSAKLPKDNLRWQNLLKRLLQLISDVVSVTFKIVADIAPEGYASTGSFDCSSNSGIVQVNGDNPIQSTWDQQANWLLLRVGIVSKKWHCCWLHLCNIFHFHLTQKIPRYAVKLLMVWFVVAPFLPPNRIHGRVTRSYSTFHEARWGHWQMSNRIPTPMRAAFGVQVANSVPASGSMDRRT
jgi:hypothetical protein